MSCASESVITDENVAQVEENVNEEEDKETEYETIEISYDWDDAELSLLVRVYNCDIPDSFSDIAKLNKDEQTRWLHAIQRELNSMETYKVWTPAAKEDRPAKLIETKWIFKMKSTENREIAKARLVAQDFQANSANKCNYAPVVGIVSLRFFLAVVIRFSLYLKQIDVETAFLNGSLNKDVFIKSPEGYETGGVKVIKLLKSLYGLPEAPKC